MQFFDSHCHFDFAVFNVDRELMWRECNAQGIAQLIIPGVSAEQWPLAASIAQQHDNMYFSVGLHPWWVKDSFESKSKSEPEAKTLENLQHQLQKSSAQPKCVALGECGLDANIATPMQLQHQVLAVHLQLAQQLSMPLIIHCRNAHNELLQQLKSHTLVAGGVIHGFSGSYELAMRYWAMGFRLGIGGTISYERANKTRTAVKKLPLAALLLETDAPDMPLSGKQGERNSPLNLIEVARTLADLRGEPLVTVAAQTTLNSRTLFKLEN